MNKKRLIFTVFSVSTIILYLGLAYVIYEMYAVMWLDLHAPESLTPYLLILIILLLVLGKQNQILRSIINQHSMKLLKK